MADIATTEVTSDLPAPAKKRSLFTKPTYTQNTEAELAVEFFSRAKDIFPERLAEEERKRQKKLAKLERQRSTANEEQGDSKSSGSKRRRVSNQEEDNNRYHYGGTPEYIGREENTSTQRASTHSTPSKRKSNDKESEIEPQGSPTDLVGRYNRSLKAKTMDLTPKKVEISKGYISLSDSDDEGGKAAVRPIVLDDDDDGDEFIIKRPVQVEDDPQLSDEEFPELVARARERERLKAMERANASRTPEARNHDSPGGLGASEDMFQAQFTSAAEADPTIELLITSEMEGANPLKVRRKLSQRLKEVRLSWCDKQRFNSLPMSTAVKDAVFFTWKGIRLYDYTTCKSLGFNKARGSGVSFDGDGFDPDGRVHLEAWTDELFRAHERIREKERLQRENGVEELPEQEEQDKTPRVRLILVPRHSKELKIVVKATTPISKLIRAFRESKEVCAGKEISLHFDGEQLDPEMTVEEADLADMDSVEVHLK